MKKALKITGITLASILGLAIIAIVIVCNIVFSPSALTPLVRDNVGRFITCEADLDTVDLTFFSSFPRFSLNATNVSLVNPMEGAPSDTLARIGRVRASVNLIAFLFRQELIIDHFTLESTEANVYVDSTGSANYNIVPPGAPDKEEDTTSTKLFELLQIESVTIDGVSARYTDRTMGVDATVDNLKGYVSGELDGANADIYADMSIDKLVAHYADSTQIYAKIEGTRAKVTGALRDNHFEGEVALATPSTTFALNADTLTRCLALSVAAPAEYNFDIQHAQLHNAKLSIAGHEIKINGPVQHNDQNGNINMDLTISTNPWDIEQVLTLVPDAYARLLDGIDVAGVAELSARATGVYSADSLNPSMPKIAAHLTFADGRVAYEEVIPYRLHAVNADIDADIDLNEGKMSNAHITSLSAKTGTMTVSATGDVTDLLGNIGCDVRLLADVNLPELAPVLPDSMDIDMKGRAKADIRAAFKLDDLTAMRLEKISANGTISYTDLDVTYNDSIFATDSQGTIGITMPLAKADRQSGKEIMKATISATDMEVAMTGMALNARLRKPEISVTVSNPLDTTRLPNAHCQITMAHLSGAMDTITFDIADPALKASIAPTKKDAMSPTIKVEYANSKLAATMGSMASVNTGRMKVKAGSRYDKKGENMLLQYNPVVDVDFHDGKLVYAQVPEIKIPNIVFQFRPNDFDIESSRIVIEHSDFNLSGKITNLRKYITKRGLLKGNLLFESSNTNVDELMAIVNGFGSTDSTTTTTAEPVEVSNELKATKRRLADANPFMVPKGVDLSFMTKIHRATFSETELDSVQGKLTVKDGVAIVEQMGFTTEAAEMQLTGMYRSDRKNHLFAGIDFHLLNIDIHSLIEMIPSIDTIVPMLKSFAGKAEFHIAAETYLNAWYEPKISTMRAAAALEGKDLVVLDNETFSTIAKYMMFNKKTKNVIDSLSVEMTVYRNEVDLYPFLVSMDKWQAVLSGRHNLDMSFNYHISLTDCPLPVRLGLDVKGTFDDMKFDLVPCKYKALYKPEKQGKVEKQTLALKKIISDSLKDNVK